MRARAPHVIAMATSDVGVGIELELQELGEGKDERVGGHHSVGGGLGGMG